MYRAFISRAAMTVILVFTVMAVFPVPSQAALQPIVYTIRIPSPESHIAEIEVTIPTEKQPSVELMMAVWSPGFYRVEDYAAKVQKLSARTSAGVELKFVSHEYFHAINVKRLRPIELGPFDYENPPKTPSLWISEGLTSYYGNLAVVRSGVGSADDFLHDLSGQIRQLQNSPGRLVQTLEQSSLDVWTDSYSGIGGDNKTTVSYYVKGLVVGFLLDAKIRDATADRRSLDDVMRLAYERYSGARGFRPGEFEAAAAEVAGVKLDRFFERALRSTEELDYSEMLEWFGLRFAPQPDPADPAKAWMLEARPHATDTQKRHLQHLFAPARRSLGWPAIGRFGSGRPARPSRSRAA